MLSQKSLRKSEKRLSREVRNLCDTLDSSARIETSRYSQTDRMCTTPVCRLYVCGAFDIESRTAVREIHHQRSVRSKSYEYEMDPTLRPKDWLVHLVCAFQIPNQYPQLMLLVRLFVCYAPELSYMTVHASHIVFWEFDDSSEDTPLVHPDPDIASDAASASVISCSRSLLEAEYKKSCVWVACILKNPLYSEDIFS